MPLTPATTDKFTKVGSPGSATTLAAPGYSSGGGGAASINVGSTTNWPTDTLVVFAIDRAQVVNGVETRIANTYNEKAGIVASATSIGNMSHQYGTLQDYAAGSLTRVYIPVASTRENALIDGLAQDHNLKGNHKTLTDDNGNEWLERGSVASAVNHVKLTNAVTGAAAKIDATGDDTNVDLEVGAKGTGVVKVQGAVPQKFFAIYNFIESGCVWSGDAYGSTRAASMTAGVVWIGGKRLTVAAVTARLFTANKDTYIDFKDAGNGTATVIYTEVVNNAASPTTLSDASTFTDATHIRNGIIITGGTFIGNVGGVNQGQEDKILPIVSSNPLQTTETNGYLICPRDPARTTLCAKTKYTAAQNTGGTTIAELVDLAAPIQVPAGRKIKVTIQAEDLYASVNNSSAVVTLWEGAVTSGRQLVAYRGFQNGGSGTVGVGTSRTFTPLTSNPTLRVGLVSTSAGNSTMDGSTASPITFTVELV
jgi:hypothetical protein